jgi:hypothetical protein
LLIGAASFTPLVVGVAAAAEDTPIVRRLEVEGLPQTRGRIAKPTAIENAEQLAKAFADEALRKAIEKQVDFSKEALYFFAWAGSGQDTLSADVAEGEVVFRYKRGLTRDLRAHTALFALKKGVKWQLAD